MKIKPIIRGLRAAFKEFRLIIYAKVTGYYKSIDKLPVYNWFKMMEGDFTYMYKIRINKYPRFFVRWYSELFFQFEKVDMTNIYKYHKLAYLESLYITTKKVKYLNQANSLRYEINKKEPKKKSSLNDMVTLIEESFSSIGTLDVHKISTSRFFNLYYRAIDKIKKK